MTIGDLTDVALRAQLLWAQADAAQTDEVVGPQLPFPVLMGIILLLGYFLVFRPQQKKQQEVRTQLENLKEKDRVVTIGGIHGRVTAVRGDADEVTIQVDEATGAKLKINKSAIARVLEKKT